MASQNHGGGETSSPQRATAEALVPLGFGGPVLWDLADFRTQQIQGVEAPTSAGCFFFGGQGVAFCLRTTLGLQPQSAKVPAANAGFGTIPDHEKINYSVAQAQNPL